MRLDHISTLEMLTTLERRGAIERINGDPDAGQILQDEAESLLRRLPKDVLNYPIEVPKQ